MTYTNRHRYTHRTHPTTIEQIYLILSRFKMFGQKTSFQSENCTQETVQNIYRPPMEELELYSKLKAYCIEDKNASGLNCWKQVLTFHRKTEIFWHGYKQSLVESMICSSKCIVYKHVINYLSLQYRNSKQFTYNDCTTNMTSQKQTQLN